MSTIQATNIKHASSASNNLALDSNGNATFANNVTVPSINSGPLAGFRNAIINGNFDIWQRATSFSSPTSGSYLSDRWRLDFDGTSATRTISRQAFTVGQTDVPNEPTYFLRFNQSVAGSGGTINVFRQRIEDVRTFAGQVITLSFYAKAAANITLPSVLLGQNFGTGGSPSSIVFTNFVTSQAITTSWAKYTYTITSPSISGKTLGSDNNSLLDVIFSLPINTTFTFDIAQVQIERGSVATPFERRPIGAELLLCQRYYQKYTQPPLRGAMNGATGAVRCGMILPVEMRAAPTATAGSFNVFDGSGVGTISSTSASYLDANVVEFDFVTNSFSAAIRPAVIYQNGTESLTLSAEL